MPDLSQITWRKARGSANNGSCVEIAAWRRSSHSAGEGQCVEIGPWHRSRHSGQEGHCIEAATDGRLVLARDSKDPGGPVLGFAPDAWEAFLTAVKSGRLDLRR